MIKSLFIKNYVLIKQMDLDFSNGFHAFTGETGAGKSIIVGALSLILGNRADYSVIRDKNLKCEISALFDIRNNKQAQKWLDEQDIEHNNEIECRRVITADGRSKSWLNTRPCTNASLKQLGSLLVQIHGQHDQIKLNNSKYQLSVIDETGQYQDLLNEVQELSQKWHEINDSLAQVELAGALNESESQLLRYQFEELEHINLQENEIDDLHNQQKALTHAVDSIVNMEKSMSILTDDGNVSEKISDIIHLLSKVQGIDFSEILSMLEEVSINLNEIETQLQSKQDDIEVNPEKLNDIEIRLDQIYSTARKHRVNAEHLFQHQIDLAEKLQLNDSQKQLRKKLLEDKHKIEQNYFHQAKALSNARQETAKLFQQKVTKVIQQLGLGKAQFLVSIQHNPEANISKKGQDNCDFEVIMNLGQAPQKMSATASGGELSRIALGIEICKKQDKQSSSFVFDEVDAGIGGDRKSVV